ncbi:microfibril-associated glycoprotein 4-like [Ylistrum balloti]|uniref:microfibril-associated glycoprotein 4-like n=1 Tax=Ylistrum balloti TaxID=509963 RepID=UPI002905F720|nr:microfibril-associated glycoprotein 4-like [Ylistrum balloti]
MVYSPRYRQTDQQNECALRHRDRARTGTSSQLRANGLFSVYDFRRRAESRRRETFIIMMKICGLLDFARHRAESIRREHDNIKGNSTQNSDIKTCGDLDSANGSGVYRITPVPDKSFDVYCDMDSEGGPWTVIQNRENNEVDFYRDWDQYKTGFGDQHGNYWLGNDGIFALTKTPCVLRIQLESVNETFGYAEYTEFQISDEAENYTLSVSGFRGNISNAFEENNGQLFSTAERDNDAYFKNCAVIRKAPWWHRRCTAVNLNGEYNVIHWRTSVYWKGFYEEDVPTRMKKTRMMLKKP